MASRVTSNIALSSGNSVSIKHSKSCQCKARLSLAKQSVPREASRLRFGVSFAGTPIQARQQLPRSTRASKIVAGAAPKDDDKPEAKLVDEEEEEYDSDAEYDSDVEYDEAVAEADVEAGEQYVEYETVAQGNVEAEASEEYDSDEEYGSDDEWLEGDDDDEDYEFPVRAQSEPTWSPERTLGQSQQSSFPEEDGFEEELVQVSRVTKVVKGGKQVAFRAVVVVGDMNGTVGVGCAKAKEIMKAVQKAGAEARKSLITFPLTKKSRSIPHRCEVRFCGANVMLRPAADGTGVIAGGAVRTVLELAGIQNCFGKIIGSANPLNNARATVKGLSELRTLSDVAKQRDMLVEDLFV